MNIKICGNQTKESVDTAVQYGATHIGFILSAGYKRSVSTDKVVSMAADVPASVKKVGVFVNEDIATVEKLSAAAKIDIVQLHGKEDQLYINKLTLPVIKVISSVSESTKYAENVLLLIDHEAGKSGASIDRNQDFSLIRQKFMIAGGLVPETVAETVRYFRQYPNFIGVDVSSGVESDGQKNAEKIKSFIKNARET